MPKRPAASTMTSGRSTPRAVANVTAITDLRQPRMLTPQRGKGDGLRHFGYQKERKFYNGVTMDDIHAEPKSTVLGIQGSQQLPCSPPSSNELAERHAKALTSPHRSMVQARHRRPRHPPRLRELARSAEPHHPARALPDGQHQARAPQGRRGRAGHRDPLRRRPDHPLRCVRARGDMMSPRACDTRSPG